jgi:signal peptidase I
MAELSGTSSSIQLAPLVRFLCGLGKSGDLLLSRNHWLGQLSFERGQLIAAEVDAERGAAALEFMAVALQGGDFEFSEGPPNLAQNLGPDPLAELDRLTGSRSAPEWLAELPPPHAVPYIVEARGGDDDNAEVRVGRRALYVLLDVDGDRSVRALATEHGLLRTLGALVQLRDAGLVAFRPSGSPQLPRLVDDRSTTVAVPPATRSVFDRLHPPDLNALSAVPGIVNSSIARTLILVAVLVFGLRSVVQNFRVEGTSMQPNLVAGQVLVVSRWAYLHIDQTPLARLLPTSAQGTIRYLFGGPNRGDVVIFRAPTEPDNDYIKRVVGLPGDSVAVRDGTVYVNGDAMREPYVEFPATYTFPDGGGQLTVPDREYFVLGDNRPDSYDSHLGWLVPVDNLIGRAWVRYWPPDSLGPVTNVAMASTKAAP